MKKILLIDADSIPYICSKEIIKESIENVDSFIRNLIENLKADGYYLFLSNSPYFRHKIEPLYKSHRQPSTLKYLKTLKTYLKEEYKAFAVEGLEADDLAAIYKTQLKEDYELQICSSDKDVVKQIPGNHYDYKKNIFINTTPSEAAVFLFTQLISGDAGDFIKGIPGAGIKKAEKVLENFINPINFEGMQNAVISEYQKCYGKINGLLEFNKNFRLLYLLRTPEDIKFTLGTDLVLQEPNFINYEQSNTEY